jgi:hypothetical protein
MAAGLLSLALGAVVVKTAFMPGLSPSRQAEAEIRERGGDPKQAATLARAALKRNPLEVRAIRTLALAQEKLGRRNDAGVLMRLSDRISRRDLATQLWLLDDALKRQDGASVVRHTDAVLRTEPDLAPQLYPTLAKIAGDPRISQPLIKHLGARPDWRWSFMSHLAEKAEPAVTFAVLEGVNRIDRVNADEVGAYLNRLFAQQQYDQALLGWILLLPNEMVESYAGLFDGEFRGLAAPLPFNWSLAGGAGGALEFAPGPDRPNDPALHVVHDGFTPGVLISQSLVIPNGQQVRLTGQAMFSTEESSELLTWRVVCVEDGRVLLRTRLQAGTGWKNFSAAFATPATGCRAQRLELLPVPGDRRTTVEAWFDKLTIEPEAA